MGDFDQAVDVILGAASISCAGDRPKMFAALVGAFGKFAGESSDPDEVVSAFEQCIRAARRAQAEGISPDDHAALAAALDREGRAR